MSRQMRKHVDLRHHSFRWGAALLRLMLIFSLIAGLVFGSTSKMLGAHTPAGVQVGSAITTAASVPDFCWHGSESPGHCAQHCCVAVCSLCIGALQPLADGLRDAGPGARIRFVTTQSIHNGIVVGLDPPPPRYEA